MAKKPLQQITTTLASMSSAIYILVIIGAISALGTLIPQGQAPDFYMQHYGGLTGRIITVLSLHRLYQAWWFLAMLLLLCLSILLCAVKRLRRTRSVLIFSSLIMHLAIILVLGGAAWSLGYGHSANIELAEGQSVSLAEFGFAPGQLTLDRFQIDYYPDYQPRQYSSLLSLQGYQGQDYHQEIAVNHPLKAGYLKIYQSSWGWMMQITTQAADGQSKSIALPDRSEYWLDQSRHLKLQAIFVPDLDETRPGINSLSPLPRNPHVLIALVEHDRVIGMNLLRAGESAQLGEYKFSLDGFSYYSGLNVKEDRGVYLVFTGFFLLLAGMLVRYLAENMVRKAA